MPQQWWISLDRVTLPIRMEHIHAVATRWFDIAEAHWSTLKPYSISPLTERSGQYGFHIGTLLDELGDVLVARLSANPRVRLGSEKAQVGTAEIIRAQTWEELEQYSGARQLEVDLLTPLTHRSGSRNSPLPNPPAIIRGLATHWEAWHGPLGAEVTDVGRALWASDVYLSSTTVDFHRQVISGSLGGLRLRCDDRALTPIADKLLRLAPYAGIGSFTLKGCGVCEVTPIGAR